MIWIRSDRDEDDNRFTSGRRSSERREISERQTLISEHVNFFSCDFCKKSGLW
ncbi:unnamed protein product [Rhodiola kirilowii]